MFHSATLLSMAGQSLLDISRDMDTPTHDADLTNVLRNARIETQRLRQVRMIAADKHHHGLGRVVEGFHDEFSRPDGFQRYGGRRDG